jgi:hypothetical protein
MTAKPRMPPSPERSLPAVANVEKQGNYQEDNIIADPGLRPLLSDVNANDQDQYAVGAYNLIERAYSDKIALFSEYFVWAQQGLCSVSCNAKADYKAWADYSKDCDKMIVCVSILILKSQHELRECVLYRWL